MITVHDVEQGTPEWLELRENLYTGSNADKLLSYSTSTKIVNGVVSSYSIAEITGFGGNFYTKRGHILEDEAIELYAQITGHKVSRPGFVTNTKYPGCGFSPDGHDDDLLVPLEVKAFEEVKHMKMFKGEIPMKVLAQNHFGQLIWEKRGSRLVIYNPDLEAKFALKIIDVRYSPAIQRNLKNKLKGAIYAPAA